MSGPEISAFRPRSIDWPKSSGALNQAKRRFNGRLENESSARSSSLETEIFRFRPVWEAAFDLAVSRSPRVSAEKEEKKKDRVSAGGASKPRNERGQVEKARDRWIGRWKMEIVG